MPQLFNACEYLLDRRLAEGDGPRTALTGVAGDVSYAALHDQVRRTAAVAAGPGPAARAAGADADGRLAAVRGGVPGRDADGRDPGPGLHDAEGRRRGRAAAGLAGPVPGRDPGVRGDRRRGRGGGARAHRDTGRRGPNRGNADRGEPAGQPGPGAPAQRAGRRSARRRGVPDHGRLARVLALHLGHDRPAQGRDAPARSDQGGLRDVWRPGPRDPPRRPVPVRRQSLLRLRPG